MEARVDLRKLQILNDRINQALDALNQVRASVRALGAPVPPQPYGVPFGGLAHSPWVPQQAYTPFTPYVPSTPFAGRQPWNFYGGYPQLNEEGRIIPVL